MQEVKYHIAGPVNAVAKTPAYHAVVGICPDGYTYPAVETSIYMTDQGMASYTPLIERFEEFKPKGGSWSAIRKSGQIKMTPMHIVNEVTENHLGVFTSVEAKAYAEARSLQCSEDGQEEGQPPVIHELLVKQPRTLDLATAMSRNPLLPYYRAVRSTSGAEVEAQKAAAWQELFQAYNLGEELYELRESIQLLASLLKRGTSLLEEGKRIFDNVKGKKGHEEALSHWMEYRYGLMPIVYSIQDIIKLSQEKGKYRTVRKRVPVKVSRPVLPGRGSYFYDNVVDASSVNITVKSRYADQATKILDLVNVNPLTTAATVYPYAFVVRWFINVNSWLDAHVKSLTTLASEYSGVIAVKDDYHKETHLRWHTDLPETISTSVHHRTGIVAQARVPRLDMVEDHVLQTLRVQNYRRSIIKPSETQLVWNPYLDWKRGLDSIALSLPYIRSALGGLLK